MSSCTKYSLNFKSKEVVLGKGNPGTKIQKLMFLAPLEMYTQVVFINFQKVLGVFLDNNESDSTNPHENLMPLCRKKLAGVIMIVGLCKFSFQKCFRNSG